MAGRADNDHIKEGLLWVENARRMMGLGLDSILEGRGTERKLFDRGLSPGNHPGGGLKGPGTGREKEGFEGQRKKERAVASRPVGDLG